MCFNASSSTPWQLVAAERMNKSDRVRERERERRASGGNDGDGDKRIEKQQQAGETVRLPRRWWRYGKCCCCCYYYCYCFYKNTVAKCDAAGRQLYYSALTVICFNYWAFLPEFSSQILAFSFFFDTRVRVAARWNQPSNSGEWAIFVLVLVLVLVCRCFCCRCTCVLLPALLLILCLFFYTHFLVHTVLLFALINAPRLLSQIQILSVMAAQPFSSCH